MGATGPFWTTFGFQRADGKKVGVVLDVSDSTVAIYNQSLDVDITNCTISFSITSPGDTGTIEFFDLSGVAATYIDSSGVSLYSPQTFTGSAVHGIVSVFDYSLNIIHTSYIRPVGIRINTSNNSITLYSIMIGLT